MRLTNILGLFAFISWATAQSSVIYTPRNLDTKTADLVVVIHGCLQNPEAMALGTGWNSIAEKNNALVLYPNVDESKNDLGCWSWYLEENQNATSGELKEIKTEITSTIKKYGLKKPKIYVTGMSSGGSTVAGLLACFPGFFTAAGIHSSPSYGLVKNVTDAQKILKDGPPDQKVQNKCDPRKNKTPIMVIQGKDDQVVKQSHALRIIEDFVGTKEPSSSQKLTANDLNFEVSSFESKAVKGQLVSVDGLGHAWAGYAENFSKPTVVGPKGRVPTIVPFFTEKGPNSTKLFWDFFKNQ